MELRIIRIYAWVREWLLCLPDGVELVGRCLVLLEADLLIKVVLVEAPGLHFQGGGIGEDSILALLHNAIEGVDG